MPNGNQIVAHPQVGPALSATVWTTQPVVGATPSFIMRVSRLGEPVSNATVTLRIEDATGTQIYPPSGALTIPPSSMPGTYMYTSSLTNIFTTAGARYTLRWNISVASTLTTPALVLPVVQQVIAQQP